MDQSEKKDVVPMGDESINVHDLLAQCKPELSADVKQEPLSDSFAVDRSLSDVKNVQNQVAGSSGIVPKAETSKASYFCAICLLNIPVTVPNVVITGNSACKRLIRDQLLKKYCKGKVEDALEGLQRKFICRRHVDDVEVVEVVGETVPVFHVHPMVVERRVYRVFKEVPDTMTERKPFQTQRVLEPLTETQVEALRRLRELLYNPHSQGPQERQKIEYDPEKLAEKQRKKNEKLMLRQKAAEQKKKEKQERKEEKRNRRDAEKERENAERRKEKVMKAKAAKMLKKTKTVKKLSKSETPETGRPVRECRQRKERHD